jgi:uncharacterized damage-inducible protein DinB
MKANLAADLAVLEEMYDSLTSFLAPLDDGCLNWAPLSANTNSIAALVSHTTGSTDGWLARAVGETIARDRDAEFHVQSTAADLIRLIAASRGETRRRFELLDRLDLGTVRQVRRLSRNEDVAVSIAWCVEHALIHAGEHWGQIQLTAQLFHARSGS